MISSLRGYNEEDREEGNKAEMRRREKQSCCYLDVSREADRRSDTGLELREDKVILWMSQFL